MGKGVDGATVDSAPQRLLQVGFEPFFRNGARGSMNKLSIRIQIQTKRQGAGMRQVLAPNSHHFWFWMVAV